MLLESKIVHVPALEELDADRNEYGTISAKTMAAFGEAACEAGDPDFNENDPQEAAIDAIGNILHWVNDRCSRGEGVNPDPIERVLEMARMHFDAEVNGEDS